MSDPLSQILSEPEVAINIKIVDGMTPRDWFAAFALAGMLAEGDNSGPLECATDAYLFADAMLKERAK